MAQNERRRVTGRIAAAVVLVVAVAGFCGATGWRPWSFGTGFEGRIAYGFACALPPLACLAVTIGRVAAHRHAMPEEIGGSGFGEPGPALRILLAVLQNTLEQVALAVPVYLAAALLLPERWLGCVAGASALFVIGRVAFARGYARGAAERAFGFGLNFYPSVGLLVASLAAVVEA